MAENKIIHMVVFSLKHEKESLAEAKFLEDGLKILSTIPVVENFRVLKQVSQKNDFDFGFSMEFASEKDYQEYNDHPDHVAFVEERWLKEVDDFMEIDFEEL